MHAFYFEGRDAYSTVVEKVKLRMNTNNILNHSDVFVLNDSVLKVDDIRELQNKISLKALNHCQCVILNGDALNTQAANALLKSLEEPKDNLYFYLYGLSRYSLLDTIRSRVQCVKTANDMSDFIERVRNEGISLEYTPIFNAIGLSIDLLKNVQDKADNWVRFIERHALMNCFEAILQTKEWESLFVGKEEQKIAVNLLQHYGKSLILQRRGEYVLWGELPTLDWPGILKFNQAVAELKLALASNGQFSMQLEEFHSKK